jgi:hypothetical protein
MDLGVLVRTFPVDTKRRRQLVALLLIGGVLLYPCSGFLILITPDDVLPLGFLVLGAAIGSFGVGVFLLWRAIARRGELFELHEHGVVHVYSGHRREVAWDRMTSVKITRQPNAWARFVGGDMHCRIKVADAKALAFTKLTQDAEVLASIVSLRTDGNVAP